MTTTPRFILVSGGDGGIGAAVCRLLGGAGYAPVVGFRHRAGDAAAIAESNGGLAVRLDLSDDQSIAQGLRDLPPLAGVVLAASPPPELLTFVRLTPDALASQFRVNVIGTHVLLAGLIQGHFRPRKSGVVVGVLSEAAGTATVPPSSGMGAYVVAKAAMRTLLDVCAVEYPWLKVRTVSPGLTRTKMLDVFDGRYLELAAKRTPISTPEDVARSIIQQIVT